MRQGIRQAIQCREHSTGSCMNPAPGPLVITSKRSFGNPPRLSAPVRHGERHHGRQQLRRGEATEHVAGEARAPAEGDDKGRERRTNQWRITVPTPDHEACLHDLAQVPPENHRSQSLKCAIAQAFETQCDQAPAWRPFRVSEQSLNCKNCPEPGVRPAEPAEKLPDKVRAMGGKTRAGSMAAWPESAKSASTFCSCMPNLGSAHLDAAVWVLRSCERSMS